MTNEDKTTPICEYLYLFAILTLRVTLSMLAPVCWNILSQQTGADTGEKSGELSVSLNLISFPFLL
jgi:hypothetical protein